MAKDRAWEWSKQSFTQHGLHEQHNRAIKDSLVKVFDGNPCDWPNIMQGVLFAHKC